MRYSYFNKLPNHKTPILFYLAGPGIIVAPETLNTTNVIYCNMLVIDSSTLILIAKSGLLDIFIDNLAIQLIIPKAVKNECTSKKELFDAKLITQRINEGKIKVQISGNLKVCKKLMSDFNIAKGEAEALSLCLKKKELLITDDKKAINACKILRLPFATALDILIRVYEKNLIDKEQVNLILEKLVFYGRYSEEIIQDVKTKLKEVKNAKSYEYKIT